VVNDLVDQPCELCQSIGGDPLWRDEFCRVVLVDDPDYPGFCRVVLGRHVAEMTDLARRERSRLMEVVFAVEAALRDVLRPHKINLASFGNATPHLHWHVVPRHREDRHFPRPIWAEPERRHAARLSVSDRGALTRSLQSHLDSRS
jgi:diadenosine tetraphosphate (Ap4A) HIT family hydrolase